MFKIQVNNNAIVHHQMIKEVAKVSAREILKERSEGRIVEAASSYVKMKPLVYDIWTQNKGEIRSKNVYKTYKESRF